MDIQHEYKTVIIDYTNWKGARQERTIVPIDIYFGKTSYHPNIQWLLDAYDLDEHNYESARKCFAMKDIHSWRPFIGESNE